MKAIGDRVVVQPNEELAKKWEAPAPSLIIIPDQYKEKPLVGTAIAVGSEVKEVKEGDVVMYPKYSGCGIIHEKIEYFIMKESDILALITKTPEVQK